MPRSLTLVLAFLLAFGSFQALGAAEPRTPSPVGDPKETTVYVTKTGAKYHSAGCQYLKRSAIPMALSEARKRFDPCSVCKPPK